MLQFYMVYEVIENKKYMRFGDQNKAFAEQKAGAENYGYVHWDVLISGDSPILNTPEVESEDLVEFIDTRTVIEKRQCGFAMEADKLKHIYDGCIVDGDTIEEAEAASGWLVARESIKSKYPKD